MGSDTPLSAAGEMSGHGHGASASAACQRLAAAALPYTHGHVIGRINANELGIDAAWKCRMPFDLRSQTMHMSIGDGIYESDAVRIAHRNASDAQRLPCNLEGNIQRRITGERGRNAF